MGLRQMQDRDGTAYVSLPKPALESDGILEDGAVPEGQHVDVRRLGTRAYLVRIPTERGDLPEVHDCEVIRRVAAELSLERAGVESGESISLEE